MAGWYFRMGADMTSNGVLLDHRYADMCRLEILKDSIRLRALFDPVERVCLLQYCDALLAHGRYTIHARLIRLMLKLRKE